MLRNVFLKSSIRRPIRNIVLILLVGIAAFSAVIRAAEYIIVSEEISRIEGFYRSIGFLSTQDPFRRNFMDFDNTEWMDVIAQSPYVDFVDHRRLITGELEGMNNTENMRLLFSSPFFQLPRETWHTFETEYALNDAYFIGTLYGVRGLTLPEPPDTWRNNIMLGGINIGGSFLIMYFDVDEVLVGRPEFLREGDPVRIIVPVMDVNDSPLLEMQIGGQYLLRGSNCQAMYRLDMLNIFHGTTFPEHLTGAVHYTEAPPGLLSRALDPRGYFICDALVYQPLWPGGDINFISTSDHQLDYVINQLQPYMRNLDRNMRSKIVQTTADMTAMHSYRANVGVVRTHQHHGGRMITRQDYLDANPVAVVHIRFLYFHELEIGDTIELTLRENIPSALPYGYTGWADERTHTLTLEIIGTFNIQQVQHNFAGAAWANGHPGDPWWFTHFTELTWLSDRFYSHFLYIPDSLIPADFATYQDYLEWDNQFSFVLNTARDERAFMEAYRDTLAALGYNLHFVPQPGAVNFFQAVDSILLTLAFNLIIFSVTSVIILALGAFVYVTLMKRNFAIMRGLGESARSAVWQMLMPAVLFWLPVIALGSILAWHFASNMADGALATIYDLEPHLAHMAYGFGASAAWIPALAAAVAAASLSAVLMGIIIMARRPVLQLLQGAGR